MRLYLIRKRLKLYFCVSFICLLMICIHLINIYPRKINSKESKNSNPSNDTRYTQYCRQAVQHMINEQQTNQPIELNPTGHSIPYSYSRWHLSPLLPRHVTQCEHAIYMDLLSKLVEHVFEKYSISYMMMAGTLLGSYTRHDLLPWDDDVDIRVPLADRQRLQTIIKNELSSEPYSINIIQMNNSRNYDKVFFSWCPHFSGTLWTYPFVDIFYQDENQTHVWLVGTPKDCPVRREDVYPLVRRPFGSIWLHAPRQPMAHFESRKWGQFETMCFLIPYSHKHSNLFSEKIIYVDCKTLKQYYPYVERQCTRDQCTEILKIGDNTIIHSVTLDYSYRTFSYFEKSSSYKPC